MTTNNTHKKQTSKPQREFFCCQHTFSQVPCVHSSTYVTATVSIIPAGRMFIEQRTLSLPHTTVPFGPPLSRTLYSYNSHTFPAPTLHTAKECKVIEPTVPASERQQTHALDVVATVTGLSCCII